MDTSSVFSIVKQVQCLLLVPDSLLSLILSRVSFRRLRSKTYRTFGFI